MVWCRFDISKGHRYRVAPPNLQPQVHHLRKLHGSQTSLLHSEQLIRDFRLPVELSPSFTLNPGDVKMVHHLRSGGKLVIQKKKNGDVAYALNCPDGRKVFLEKTKENAVLSLTDAQGHSIKTLACEF
ncbi:hypothetical protein COOONC_01921 [Cooperia oncophora]